MIGRCLILPALALAVAACSSHGEDGAAISADDQRQLNDAAAMLDANGIEPAVLNSHESSPHD